MFNFDALDEFLNMDSNRLFNDVNYDLFTAIEKLSPEEKAKYLVTKDNIVIGSKVYDRIDDMWAYVRAYDDKTNTIYLVAEENGTRYTKNVTLGTNILWGKPEMKVKFYEFSKDVNAPEEKEKKQYYVLFKMPRYAGSISPEGPYDSFEAAEKRAVDVLGRMKKEYPGAPVTYNITEI